MNYELLIEANCDICEKKNFQILSNTVQFNMPYRVVICKDCGLVQINPKPHSSELNKFYINEYDKRYPLRDSSDLKFKERGHRVANFVKEILKSSSNIIEIGAGSGGNLIGMAEKITFKKLRAIEPNKNNISSLQDLGIDVVGEFYETCKYDLTDIDTVLMSHVFEHFYSPKECLIKLHNETRKDVNMIILVPSIGTYKEYYPLHEYWFRVVHLFYFNLNLMTNLLNITGWEIIKSYDKNGELAVVVKKNKGENNKVIDNFYSSTYNDYENYKKELELKK